jgi:hypothetical protein
MNNLSIYQKPGAVRYNLSQIVGHGLLVAEGMLHYRLHETCLEHVVS